MKNPITKNSSVFITPHAFDQYRKRFRDVSLAFPNTHATICNLLRCSTVLRPKNKKRKDRPLRFTNGSFEAVVIVRLDTFIVKTIINASSSS